MNDDVRDVVAQWVQVRRRPTPEGAALKGLSAQSGGGVGVCVAGAAGLSLGHW